MPANDVTLYAQWEENAKPISPTPDNNTDKASANGLPKTGGYEYLLISLLTLGSGVMISAVAFKKK